MFIPCLWVFFFFRFFLLPFSFPSIPEFHLMVIFKTLITEDISFSPLPTSIRIHSFGHATWYGLWETRGICVEPYWTINFHFNMTSEDIEVASVSSLGHMLIPPTWLIRRETLSLFLFSLAVLDSTDIYHYTHLELHLSRGQPESWALWWRWPSEVLYITSYSLGLSERRATRKNLFLKHFDHFYAFSKH